MEQKKDNIILSAPYYGKRGSICKVKEEGNNYIVTRYGLNGKEGEVLITPKRYKNKLINNYIDDLKTYLERNNAKFETCMNLQSKEVISKKKAITLVGLLTTISVASIMTTITTSGTALYTSIASFVISFICDCNAATKLTKCLINEKNTNFINQYKIYQKKVVEHNKENTCKLETERTKYSKLENNKTPMLDMNKKLKRIKK